MTALRDEAGRFIVTVLRCTRQPKAFAAAWFAGETRAPNPIAYVSTALAISAAARSATAAIVGLHDDNGVWSSLATATLPYAYYVLLGVLCHAVLRFGGTTRPLRASLAIALYVGGGPGLLLTLSLDLDLLLYAVTTGGAAFGNSFAGAPRWAMPILLALALGTSALFLMSLASGLRGLHGGSRLRAVVAIVVALVVSGLLLGALHAVFDFTLGVPHFLLHFGGALIAIQF